MSFDKQIQDKFSGFEPEVPEEHIDAGWEKIKYFLPQEEEQKKRVFFFYRQAKGMGMVAAAALIFALFFLFMKEGKKTNAGLALQSTWPTPSMAGPENAENYRRASTQHAEKSPGPEAAQVAASAFGRKQESEAPPVIHQQAEHSSIAQLHGNHSSVAKTSKNTNHLNETNPGTSNSIENTLLVSIFNTPAATNPEWMLLLKQTALDPERPLSPEPKLALLSADQAVQVLPNKRTASLEFFSGLANRSLMLQTGQEKNTTQAYGFSAGMAGIFPVKSKLYLSGQFIFCYNPMQYHEETKANAITKKEIVRNTISSINSYEDTLIYHVPYTSTFKLESNTVYHLSGGIGYELLNRGRISLDAALFLNFRWMRYSYSISRVNSDTGIFVNNAFVSNAMSFYESVEKSASPESASGKRLVMSVGINPCLNLAYQLNRNTALLFRPAYMIQLSPNTVEANGKSYRLKENNWFINLGLRRRF